MNADLLCGLITDAQKQNKAVELYINLIHERITIEPEEKIDILDVGILQINEKIFISTQYVSMVQIVKNKEEREEEFKKLFDEIAKKGEEKECFN